ncbi:Uma2 family endonuclease [Sphingomonas sp.]|uniref:Uma2 family endonuclease n=1 Tax=Sphingomonas sp. TaxID=28214 RepID=UPI001B15300F|nr:Uma2 family endonuclease [Sphingomonas sp.]MBO9714829.1 Uma2 family endonuclease [Sphingomonas sp.]
MNEQTPIVRTTPTVPFTADDFLRMMDRGAFEDMRAELVQGEIEKMMPSHWGHGELLIRLGGLLGTQLRSAGAPVGGDVVIRIDDTTVRAADISVLHPGTVPDRVLIGAQVLLAIEIADTTLDRDMSGKRIDYAAAGIAHYWVFDIAREVVHIFGEPVDGDYSQVATVRFDEPLALPLGAGSITLA